MGKYITEVDLSGLSLGGLDGGIHADAAEVVTGVKCCVVEVREDGATFSTLTAKDKNNVTVNMLTGVNNYDSVTFDKGELIYAPFGGYISAFTCSGITRRFTLQDSNVVKNQL